MGGTLAYWSWSSTTAQQTNVAFTVKSNFSCAADIGGNVSSNEANLIPTSDCTSEDYAIQRTVTVRPTISTNAPADLTISMDLWLEVESITSGVSNSSNFRYALTTSSTSCETGIVSSGSFKGTSEGSRLSLLSGNEYNATTTETYYLYIWLDELETDPATMNQTFELSINGECINETKEAYAVYSETDNSLRFYKSVEPLSVGDTYIKPTRLDNKIWKYDNLADGLSITGTNYILLDKTLDPHAKDTINLMFWTDYETIPNTMQDKYFYGTIKVYAWQEIK